LIVSSVHSPSIVVPHPPNVFFLSIPWNLKTVMMPVAKERRACENDVLCLVYKRRMGGVSIGLVVIMTLLRAGFEDGTPGLRMDVSEVRDSHVGACHMGTRASHGAQEEIL
jgi:hypothetical protein